jgi:FkbM family methyltransferase
VIDRLRRLLGRPRRHASEFANALLAGTRMVGVDVGGALGLPGHWWTFHGSLFFYAFEPHGESFERLVDLYQRTNHPELYKVLPIALSGTGGTRTFYCANEATGSSLLKPRREGWQDYVAESYFLPLREETIETRTLQDVLDEFAVPAVDLIKLDIQGAELEVLRGMGAARLDRLLLVETEIGLHRGYEGNADFGGIDGLLLGHGMECLDIRVARAYRPRSGRPDGYQREIFDVYMNSPTISARAWEVDAVYFRTKQSVLATGDPAIVRKLVVAYCGYNFFSEAYHLVEKAREKALFSQEEAVRMTREIIDWHRALHRRFYHAPRPFYDAVRRFLLRRHWGQGARWAQYMWLEYPNC